MSQSHSLLERRAILKWAVLGVAAGCVPAYAKRRPPQVEIPVEDLKAAAMTGNLFACDLQQLLKENSGNWFCSPASISTALAMTSIGAKQQTKQEMLSVLHAGDNPAEWLHGMGGLSQLLNSEGEGHVLRMVNQLWGQDSYPFVKDFLQQLDRKFAAGLQELDFINQPEQSRQKINRWVEKQTADRIKDLLPSGSITELSRLVLTNAIYMKADWLHGFKKEHTREQPFHLDEEQSVSVPLMAQKKKFAYTEDENTQIVSLPYKSGELSMMVLLPKPKTGLADLESKLTMDQIERWQGSLRKRDVQLFLPKFKLESSFNLNRTLSTLGMPTAFGPQADFTGIADKEELSISDVVHKAFVEVDEQGTEAAAATGVIIGVRSARPQPTPVFRADHPFLFTINHDPTGAILFMGRMQKPV